MLAVKPAFAIDRVEKAIRLETTVRIGADAVADLDTVLENQVATQFPATEALVLKNLFQCHFHSGIVKEFRHKNAKIVFMSLYGSRAIKKPHDAVGFPRSCPIGN